MNGSPPASPKVAAPPRTSELEEMTTVYQSRGASPQSLTVFVNRALHDASLASTPNGAIDTLADALIRLAALAQNEVRYA